MSRKLITTGILMLCVARIGLSQPAAISGVINSYAKVQSITGNTVAVNSPAGIRTGDEVVIIQMQGAMANVGNNAAFGATTNINHTGNYEFASVRSVAGNIITLDSITKSYDATQAVQLVRVPKYPSAVVATQVTASAWNGAVGGVVGLDGC